MGLELNASRHEVSRFMLEISLSAPPMTLLVFEFKNRRVTVMEEQFMSATNGIKKTSRAHFYPPFDLAMVGAGSLANNFLGTLHNQYRLSRFHVRHPGWGLTGWFSC